MQTVEKLPRRYARARISTSTKDETRDPAREPVPRPRRLAPLPLAQPPPQGHPMTNAYPDSWLRSELRAKVATIAELRVRLDATERHNEDLRMVNSQLRADLEQARAQLREASAVVNLLPDITT